MGMKPPRWSIITPSEYPWEQDALDFVREQLPDHDPYRAWSNFEFQTPDGAIHEVDLLVLTKVGFYLVEIKSWPGLIRGDSGTWTWEREGKRSSYDNPLHLANRKAKVLKGLIERQRQFFKKTRCPYLESLVFLSAPDVQCQLSGTGRDRVLLRDRDRKHPDGSRDGIREALVNGRVPGLRSRRPSIDTRDMKAVSRALEKIGVRRSQKARRIGDYVMCASTRWWGSSVSRRRRRTPSIVSMS